MNVMIVYKLFTVYNNVDGKVVGVWMALWCWVLVGWLCRTINELSMYYQ